MARMRLMLVHPLLNKLGWSGMARIFGEGRVCNVLPWLSILGRAGIARGKC